MGFLSKAFKKAKKQIQPNNMMIGSLPKRPRRQGGFLSRLRGNMGSDFRMPQIEDMRFRGNMPRRGGGMGGLGEAIRRLNEQRGGDMGMPRMPGIDFGGQIGYKRPNKSTLDNFREVAGRPNPFARSNMPAEIDISALERLPMGDQPMPPMPKDLPEVESVGMMPPGMGDMQPRVRMAEGDEVFMPSNPNQMAFSIETEIKNLMNEYEMAVRNNEMDRAMMLNKQINELEARRIQAMNEAKAMEGGRTISDLGGGRTISDMDRQMGRTMSDLDMSRPQLAGGGDFPDLTGDGKVTQADILKGRGVYAEGDEVMMMQGNEIESMLSGMDSGEQEAMGELEQMAPEMEIIDQLVMMVAQMIQQGADEQQVISFLREQGLDDEDIGTVFQLVAEMAETEKMAEDQIGNELAQLG